MALALALAMALAMAMAMAMALAMANKLSEGLVALWKTLGWLKGI